jgi:hypothetical protein
MKIRFVFILMLGISTINSKAQVVSKEIMVQKIFSVFHDKDEAGYIRLFPDAAGTRYFLMEILKRQSGVDTTNPAFTDLFNEITDSSLKEEYLVDFHRYLKKGEKNGVDWSKTVFVSYAADSVMSTNPEIPFPELSGKIYFKSGGVDYFMNFREVLWFMDKGWVGMDISRVDKKENEGKVPDDENEDLMN